MEKTAAFILQAIQFIKPGNETTEYLITKWSGIVKAVITAGLSLSIALGTHNPEVILAEALVIWALAQSISKDIAAYCEARATVKTAAYQVGGYVQGALEEPPR